MSSVCVLYDVYNNNDYAYIDHILHVHTCTIHMYWPGGIVMIMYDCVHPVDEEGW